VERLTVEEIRRPFREPLRLAARAYKLGLGEQAARIIAEWAVEERITREEAVKRLKGLIERAEKEGKTERR